MHGGRIQRQPRSAGSEPEGMGGRGRLVDAEWSRSYNYTVGPK
jgi:hypothetical protein